MTRYSAASATSAMGLENSGVVFAAHGMQVKVHRHRCYQVLLSLDQPFSSTIDGVVHSGKYGLIINQDVPHACNASSGSALIYFISSDGDVGRRLKRMLGTQRFLELGKKAFDLPLDIKTSPAHKGRWRGFAGQVLHDITQSGQLQAERLRDHRIVSAIDFLTVDLGEKISLQDVADHTFLSLGRARHLFAEETGTSFSQFMLWRRLKKSIDLVVHGQLALTEAALQTGFTDQAHFCRTFMRTFGVTATGLLKNSRYIQFIYP